MKHPFRATPLQYITYVIISTVTLAIVLQVFTSVRIDSWKSVLLGILFIQLIQALLQPIFALVARILGMLGILLVCMFGYSIVIWAALEIVPGIENVSFSESLVAAWFYAIALALLQWVMLARSEEYFLHRAMRSSRKKQQKKTDVPGFVFMQLDGVSAPVFEWQINTGNLPNIKQLLDSDTYVFTPWHTQLPSTTPASQAGILHGSHDGIPAFRWYERTTDKLFVANQPRDAALIEKRLSNGRGLLADGGVSIGNLFSGDAEQNIMVMSKLDGNRQSLRAMREYTDYFSNIYGFMRALVLSIGEMIKEVYQAERQKLRNFQPRVNRKASYIVLRAVTNVLLRDLQTAIVVDQMMQGSNSIYVDYVDYDEIAHHAGIARPESLAALTGLDQTVGMLTKAAKYTPRPYHIILLSDHGQSQGQTFKQLNEGKNLEQVLGNILDSPAVRSSTSPVEQQSASQLLSAYMASGKGAIGSTARRFGKSHQRKASNNQSPETKSTAKAEAIVTGSGNLGNIWLKHFKKRPSRQQIESRYPGLFEKLLQTPGIGLVLVSDGKAGPVCLGKQGQIDLLTEKVQGNNPLGSYKNIRIKDLLNLARKTNSPDIQIISSKHPGSGEVYAFEELVGNHGGIGGWQTEAILVYPKELAINRNFYENGELYDSTTIHKIFVEWLTKAGHRLDKAKR